MCMCNDTMACILQELEREYRGQMENDEGFMWQNLQRMQLTLRAPLIPAEKERCKVCTVQGARRAV